MSANARKSKKIPKYAKVLIMKNGRLVIETNDDKLIAATRIFLAQFGFSLDVETISPCG